MGQKIGLRRLGDSKAGKANTARYAKKEVAVPKPVVAPVKPVASKPLFSSKESRAS